MCTAGSVSLQHRHAFSAANDFAASGRCSCLYQASNAARLPASATVARTMNKHLDMGSCRVSESPTIGRGSVWRAPRTPAARRARGAPVELPVGLAHESEAGGRTALAHGEAPLRLLAQHGDEVGTLAGLAAQGLIRDDQGRS